MTGLTGTWTHLSVCQVDEIADLSDSSMRAAALLRKRAALRKTRPNPFAARVVHGNDRVPG